MSPTPSPHRFLPPRPLPPPTPRQVAILRQLFRSGTILDAAEALGITRNTARNHLSELYHRLGVDNGYEAAYLLWLAGLWRDDRPRFVRVVPG